MLHRVSFIIMLLLSPFYLYSANQTPHRAHQEPLMLKLDDCGVSILVEKENDSFRFPTFYTLIHKTNVTEDSLHIGNMPGRKIVVFQVISDLLANYSFTGRKERSISRTKLPMDTHEPIYAKKR